MSLSFPEHPALEFLAIYGMVYAVTALLYFTVGGAISRINARHPDNRIQERSGDHRRGMEIRQSLRSLLATSFCLAFGLFAQRQGWTITPWAFEFWPSIFMLIVSIILYDAWFYFVHRLQHSRWLYRWHALHHKSLAPTVWTNYHDSIADALGQQGYFAVAPFFLPIPPEVLIAHRVIDHFNGMLGHCGFEYLAGRTAAWPSPLVCTTFHDQHHSGFRYNYANHFSSWDRVFGTLHPDYDRLACGNNAGVPLGGSRDGR